MKRVLSRAVAALVACVLLTLGGSAAALPYDAEVLADGPFAYWRLGEAAGPTASSEVGGIAPPYSGGVAFSAPSLIASDVANTAVSFDGSSGWVDVPDHPLINTGGPYTQKTIELWFMADDVSDPTRIQMLYEEGGAARGLNLYLVGNVLYFGGWNFPADDPTTPWGALSVASVVSSGGPYHAVLTYEYDAVAGFGFLTGYLNGVSLGSAFGTGRLFAHPGDPGLGAVDGRTYYVHSGTGSPPGGPRDFFDGTVDEVALYNSVLSAARVDAHYQAATPEPSRAALFAFGLLGLAFAGRRRR